MIDLSFATGDDANSMDIAYTEVMTGDRDRRMYLYYRLIQSMEKATQIDSIVRNQKKELEGNRMSFDM